MLLYLVKVNLHFLLLQSLCIQWRSYGQNISKRGEGGGEQPPDAGHNFGSLNLVQCIRFNTLAMIL